MHALRLAGISLLAMLAVPMLQAASPAQQDFTEAVARTPDLARGQRLYNTCAGCHRDTGLGNLDGSVPVIAGQHRQVLIRQLADYRHARRWDPRMQRYADVHVLADPQAIADVAGYIESLPRSRAGGTGRGDLVEGGRALFAARCASCHGAKGEGDADEIVPRIGGQHHDYLLRVFNDAVEGTRPSFPADHLRLLEGLSGDDRLALADALARWP
jgi:cytochrome c553